MNFGWQKIRLSEHRFLSPLADLYGDIELENFTLDPSKEFSRTECDGVITLRGWIGERMVGIIFNDFRVNGGSFGKACGLRASTFIREMDAQGCPIILALNTIGLRIMEGRTVARNSFSMVPALKKFTESNLLITVTVGRCLGIGAILFALGQYRVGIRGEGLLSLAGPEVMRLFFGAKVAFEDLASVERNFEQTPLVHELLADKGVAFKRIRQLLLFPQAEAVDFPETVVVSASLKKSDPKLFSILSSIGESPIEVFGQRSAVVRAFILKRKDHGLVGVLINPPGNANNMISTATLQKYSDAMDFFKAMGVPVISVLDAPGVDPRVEQMDNNLLKSIVDISLRIMDYPHGLMGVVAGRCFGGSSVLGFPRYFGSNRVVAFKGCQLGIMHESIITQLLSSSPRLQEEWNKASQAQTPDLKDLIDEGIIDALIDESDLGAQVELFLEELRPVFEAPVEIMRPVFREVRRLRGRHLRQPLRESSHRASLLVAQLKNPARSRH